jgi:hypothetical protein
MNPLAEGFRSTFALPTCISKYGKDWTWRSLKLEVLEPLSAHGGSGFLGGGKKFAFLIDSNIGALLLVDGRAITNSRQSRRVSPDPYIPFDSCPRDMA